MTEKQEWLLTLEKARELIADLLGDEMIEKGLTHEKAPPVAASNPILSPMRSGGEKHKRCMECWENWIKGLSIKILSIIQPLIEQAKKEGR